MTYSKRLHVRIPGILFQDVLEVTNTYGLMHHDDEYSYGMTHTGRLDIILMSGISLRVVTFRIRKFENGHLGYTLD